MRVSIVLTAALAILAIAIFVALSRAPLVSLGASSTKVEGGLAAMQSGDTICQTGETLPRGTSAIRFALYSAYGPSITVKALLGTRVLAQGWRGNEWVGPTAVAVKPLSQSFAHVKVCETLGTITESTTLSGGRADGGAVATRNGAPLSGRTRIEYLRPGPKSWLTLAPSIVEHMGLGRADGGSWIAFLLIALVLAMLAIASRTVLVDLK